MKITFKRFLQYSISLIGTSFYLAFQYLLYVGCIRECTRLNIGAISIFVALSFILLTFLIMLYKDMEIIKFKE